MVADSQQVRESQQSVVTRLPEAEVVVVLVKIHPLQRQLPHAEKDLPPISQLLRDGGVYKQ